MNWKLLLIINFLMLLFFSSCLKQNEEYYKNQIIVPCDTTNIKYSSTILPILQNNCFSCHGTAIYQVE